MSATRTISCRQLAEQAKNESIEIIDVRTPLEFGEIHVSNARCVPLDQLDPIAIMSEKSTAFEEPIYVICKGGKRGAKAQQKFANAGYTNVVNVEGGTDAWIESGLPVVRGKKGMSLERQVRIAAGFIVLAGATAAIVTGNVYLAGIPAFVGAGLMFAGITDTCGMGMLIAKMPWNRVAHNAKCCQVKS
jgi:rhodanese-related sulfurtransferase